MSSTVKNIMWFTTENDSFQNLIPSYFDFSLLLTKFRAVEAVFSIIFSFLPAILKQQRQFKLVVINIDEKDDNYTSETLPFVPANKYMFKAINKNSRKRW